jgi:hypothetical protein
LKIKSNHFAPLRLCENGRLNEGAHFSQRRKGAKAQSGKTPKTYFQEYLRSFPLFPGFNRAKFPILLLLSYCGSIGFAEKAVNQANNAF